MIASQKGDPVSFNRLVLKWERSVYSLAIRMLRDREEAAEATQDIFLLAYKSIRRFRLDSKFSTWLYRIAINHCATLVRRRPPGIHLSLDRGKEVTRPVDPLTMEAPQSGELLRSEGRERVLHAISFLPLEQQVVIELKFFEEMTFEEMAKTLGEPLSTIKSRLYSALELLKVRLGNQD